MNFGKNVWVETPHRVKIFQNFHFQNTSPIILKKLAKKKFNSKNFSYMYLKSFWKLTLSNCLWWSSDQSCSLSSCLEEKFNLQSWQTNFWPPMFDLRRKHQSLFSPKKIGRICWALVCLVLFFVVWSLCLHSKRLCLHPKYSLKRAKTFEIQMSQSHDEKNKVLSTLCSSSKDTELRSTNAVRKGVSNIEWCDHRPFGPMRMQE